MPTIRVAGSVTAVAGFVRADVPVTVYDVGFGSVVPSTTEYLMTGAVTFASSLCREMRLCQVDGLLSAGATSLAKAKVTLLALQFGSAATAAAESAASFRPDTNLPAESITVK